MSEKRLRVVLADDTKEYRDLLRIILEQDGGFEIVGMAANGEEAVAVTRAELPDAIVLDLAMPVMDGLQAIPLLLDCCPETAIVVLSGFARGQVDAEALARGASAYVEKGEAFAKIASTLMDVTAAGRAA